MEGWCPLGLVHWLHVYETPDRHQPALWFGGSNGSVFSSRRRLGVVRSSRLVLHVRLFFDKGSAIGRIDFFFDSRTLIVFFVDRACKVNKGFIKYFLSFQIPNIIFYLPEVLIDLFEALDECVVNFQLETFKCDF